eukprot:scaffold1054_cov159-Skeletonema_marinoi.AAC.3
MTENSSVCIDSPLKLVRQTPLLTCWEGVLRALIERKERMKDGLQKMATAKHAFVLSRLGRAEKEATRQNDFCF